MTPRMDGHYGGGAEAFGFNEDTVRRYTEGWCWELALSVITSYSIHYTKLYDVRQPCTG